MLPSANDGANVIAEMVSGTISEFVEELNQFLREIGCKNTHFTSPHGLPDPEHKTTARDLARIGQVGMKDPIFREIVSSYRYVKKQTNKQPETILDQHNALVKPRHKRFYPYATGIKIGYTIQAGHAILASAQKGDRSLIAVVAHKEGAAQRDRNVIQLFETAFTEVKQTRTLLSQAHDVFSKHVEGARTKLTAKLEENVTVSFYPSEENIFHSELHWNVGSLPILEGTNVGEIRIFNEYNVLQKTTLIVAVKSVEPTISYQIEQRIEEGKLWIQKRRIYIAYVIACTLFALAMLAIRRAKKRDLVS
jgi:D-alanyl-D-alanine carboxypeptidase (penicillin-binding protein 5/6)